MSMLLIWSKCGGVIMVNNEQMELLDMLEKTGVEMKIRCDRMMYGYATMYVRFTKWFEDKPYCKEFSYSFYELSMLSFSIEKVLLKCLKDFNKEALQAYKDSRVENSYSYDKTFIL